MISVEEAQKLVAGHGLAPREEEMLLPAALGRILSRDIQAPVPLPIFDNSAMDGYGLRAQDTAKASEADPVSLLVQGIVKAGDGKVPFLKHGTTCRIMTGSPVPSGVDTVLPKEHAQIEGGTLVLKAPMAKGKNVRYRGEEIRKGETVLRKGSLIQPGTVGFLSGLGIDRVKVHQAPRVSLISTGSELTPPGHSLTEGRIFDSNTPMICAALDEMRIRPVFTRRLTDQPALIKKVVRFALRESEIVVLMGGVSVGDFDHVKSVLAGEGVKTVFWKVSQKPGKPLYFGTKEGRLVFGLPGNPASVFTCFYEYVYPAIRRAMGHAEPGLASAVVRLAEPLKQEAEKTLFIKARLGASGTVSPLKKQQSHMLSAFCEADSFVVVSGPEKTLEKDEKVTVHALPYAAEGAR